MIFRSRRDRLLTIARQLLTQYRQNLRQLESRCLRSLLHGLGGVAIASVLLAPGAAHALESASSSASASASSADYYADAQAERHADQTVLSFEMGTASGREGDRPRQALEDRPETHYPTQVSAIPPGRVISSADGSRSLDREKIHGEKINREKIHRKKLGKSSADSGIGTKLGTEAKLPVGAISLQLPEPNLVASAPLSLANSLSGSAKRSGQAPDALHADKPIPEAWWHQGEKSPIAVAIGAAEGTRSANGGKTDAYYWHPDPGNGADNFGTFSYQHLPHSLTQAVRQQSSTAAKREVSAQEQLPEISDRAQIQRLRKFHDQLQQQAAARGIVMSQLELLNGLDLANQSEAAALWPEGYVDRLAQLKALTDDPDSQILEARAWSYWNPERKDWDAPGLGNTYANVLQDQRRRYDAIRAALEQYPPASGSGRPETVSRTTASSTTVSSATVSSAVPPESTLPYEVAANQIIAFRFDAL